MADNVAVTPGSGATIATDDVAGVQYQRVKVDGGGDGAATPILAGGGVEASALRVTIASDSTGVLSVDDNGGSLTVDGTVAVTDGGGSITVDGTVTVQDGGGAISVDDNGSTLSIDDGAGSITIDAPVGTPAFVRLSDGAAAISALPVTDNAGSLTVDAPVGTPVFTRLSNGTSALGVNATGPALEVSLSTGDVTVNTTTAAAGDPLGVRVMAQDAVSGYCAPIKKASPGGILITGDVAHDGADAGYPVKVGGKALTAGTFPTAVASGDRVNLLMDLFGRPRVVAERTDVRTLGVYYYHTDILSVTAAADGAASSPDGQIWIHNPSGSSRKVRIRRITFRSQLSSALAAVSCPRFTVEKSTYTGTPSGAEITPTKRRSGDSSPSGKVRTAATGMTIAASTVVGAFFGISSATAVSYTTPVVDVWQPGEDEWLELDELDVVVIRQADAGTTSDTRKFFLDIVTEEY